MTDTNLPPQIDGEDVLAAAGPQPSRTRRRRRLSAVADDDGKARIVERVTRFHETDTSGWQDDIDARLQRYAKLRMWTEGKDWPWPNSCFSLDTDILTDEGWRPVASIGVGDYVYTRDPEGRASYRAVARVNRVQSNIAVAFSGKSIDLLVTLNHRMLIENWARRTQFIAAEDLVGAANKAWSIPLTSQWSGENPRAINGIPARQYVRLLGYYISEGSKNTGGTLGIAQCPMANPEKCRIIESDLVAAKITWRRNKATYSLHSKSMPAALKEEWRQIGTSAEKLLPGHVLSLSPDLLAELVDALVLGDGSVGKNGHREYYTTSRALADQLQIIMQKIGKRATISVRSNAGCGNIKGRKVKNILPLYVVSLNTKLTIQARKLSAEFVISQKATEFACVNVPPYHTLYVRRGGKAVWCGNSDIGLPDIMEKSLRVQDTLHNAVMSARPPIGASAIQKQNREKEDVINDLIDYQVFVEQDGERIVGDLADAFVNDGHYVAFIPWVKEMREASEALIFDPIPEDQEPARYFETILTGEYGGAAFAPANRGDGWDWIVQVSGDDESGLSTETAGADGRLRVGFYTDADGRVEMITKRSVEVYNGPRIIVKAYEDVLTPPRAANLQIPGPSNPGGATHVILIDRPTVDEIKRLVATGYYDLVTIKDIEPLEDITRDTSGQELEKQKDVMEGKQGEPAVTETEAKSHKTITRLMCFDMFDVDGDGIDEDVIWWVLLEPKLLVRAKLLSEVHPALPPRRPFAEASFLPIRDRRTGISMPELIEGLHDVMKMTVDQTVDNATITNVPFFFYRAAGGIQPETIRFQPGEGYAVMDPQRDVNFPRIESNSVAFGLNMFSLIQQQEERLTMVGDFQFGRVPAGRASALRTVGGMAMLAGQGEARPERILRRFFLGLVDIWRHIHEMNQHFMPAKKRYRIVGFRKEGEDPYREIESREAITGRFNFDFKANVLNTSKALLQQSLAAFGQVYVTELAIQLGIADADGIFRWMRDLGRSWGLDPDQWMKPPSEESRKPKIFAEDAISAILGNTVPTGVAAEAGGAAEHAQKLQEFVALDEFGLFDEPQLEVFQAYLAQVMEQAAEQQRQAQLFEAARAFGQATGQQAGPGRPPEGVEMPESGAPPVSGPGELIDKSLPGAGGGGAQAQ